MKILSLLTLAIMLTATPKMHSAEEVNDFKLVFHLFNPFPQDGMQKRLNAFLGRVRTKTAEVGNYQVAFMKEVRLFLYEEIKAAIIHSAQCQMVDVDADALAEKILQEKFERSYAKAYPGETFFANANPFELPEHCFTYCLREYLTPLLLHRRLPEPTRDLSSFMFNAMHYAQYLRIGIKYTKDGIAILERVLDSAGVPELV